MSDPTAPGPPRISQLVLGDGNNQPTAASQGQDSGDPTKDNLQLEIVSTFMECFARVEHIMRE